MYACRKKQPVSILCHGSLYVQVVERLRQWCSPGMLTRGAVQKLPELAEGGGVQYDTLEILNFVGVYSNNWDKHSTLLIILIKNNCR